MHNYFTKLSHLWRFNYSVHSNTFRQRNTCRKIDDIHKQFTYYFSEDFPKQLKDSVVSHFLVYPDFITGSEENNILAEVEPKLKRMRYEYDHWDKAITGFRECERRFWNKDNEEVLGRIRSTVFDREVVIPFVHVLDLHEKGHIKAHVDSVRFCGDAIAGLNLLSDAVMRLRKDGCYHCDVLLKRRALYVMSGPVRYDFTHEVLPNEVSVFNGKQVKKSRRISVIMRSERLQPPIDH